MNVVWSCQASTLALHATVPACPCPTPFPCFPLSFFPLALHFSNLITNCDVSLEVEGVFMARKLLFSFQNPRQISPLCRNSSCAHPSGISVINNVGLGTERQQPAGGVLTRTCAESHWFLASRLLEAAAPSWTGGRHQSLWGRAPLSWPAFPTPFLLASIPKETKNLLIRGDSDYPLRWGS